MHITYFTIATSVLWSSVVFLIFYVLRRKRIVLEACSLSGIIVLYLFCMIRLFVPLEFSWTRMLYGGKWFNQLNDFVQTQVPVFSLEFSIIQILLFVWGVGAGLGILYYFLRYNRLIRFFKKLPKCEDEIVNEVLQEITAGEKRQPEVLKSILVSVPCCFGVWKRRILLPIKTYPKETLRFILQHECTHLKCKDTAVNLLTNVLCACYWWNPLVYLLKRDLRQSMELRCDRAVVETMGEEARGRYLQVLLTEYKKQFYKGRKKRIDYLVSELLEEHTAAMVERFKVLENWKPVTPKTGKILTFLLSAIVLAASYSVTFQSRYECPIEEIETDSNAIAIEEGDVYLIENDDGTYTFVTEAGEITVKYETVELLRQTGVPVRKESK